MGSRPTRREGYQWRSRRVIDDELANLLKVGYGKVHWLPTFAVELVELVEILSQELTDNEQVLFVVEKVWEREILALQATRNRTNHLDKIVLVWVSVGLQVVQELHFVKTLIEKVLVVLDNLEAHLYE